MNGHPMATVVKKVFQAEKLDGAHLSPVSPVHSNIKLSGLIKGKQKH